MKYTIEELQALPDKKLNELAAELRGINTDWQLSDFTPVYDRNLSYRLLRWAASEHGATFLIPFDLVDDEIEVTIWETRSPINPRVILTVPGNDARAETVAFCAAMLAMKEGLTQ